MRRNLTRLPCCARTAVGRTLSGHRSNCTAVQVHPFNNIVASGSLDTNVKVSPREQRGEPKLSPTVCVALQLWDVRKRHEFITFKGHSKAVKVLRFSPDGRWVASGGADSCVKVGTCVLCCVLSPHLNCLVAGVDLGLDCWKAAAHVHLTQRPCWCPSIQPE